MAAQSCAPLHMNFRKTGKTTLISIIGELVNPSTGMVSVGGHDIIQDFLSARA